MSDPIDKLSRLGDALEGAPMPLPASEIRARGDRIRHRRHAVIAGASAAVVAAVAIPVVAFSLNNDEPKEIPPSNPSVTDSVPAPTLEFGESNLLTSKDAIYPNGGSDWVETETNPTGGIQPSFSPCEQTTLDSLGAEEVHRRYFDFVILDTQTIDPTLLLNEVVAQFPDADAAESAYGQFRVGTTIARPDSRTSSRAASSSRCRSPSTARRSRCCSPPSG